MRTVDAVAGQVRYESGFTESLPQIVARLSFVLDDEDLHHFLPQVRFPDCSQLCSLLHGFGA